MTPDAKGVCAVPATGSKKIDTVAAELVPRKRPAASVLNSRRRILRRFRNTTLGGVRPGGAWAHGVNPARESEGTSNVDRLEVVRVLSAFPDPPGGPLSSPLERP
jgi:hypothetical protein